MKTNHNHITLQKTTYLLFLGLLILANACFLKPEKPSELAQTTFQFLDSTAAAKHIVKDEKEAFFEKITRLDIHLQLGVGFDTIYTDADLLKIYREYLENDVRDFSAKDKEFVGDIMQEAIALTEKILGEPLTPSINLIKSAGTIYGKGTFYTRENSIIIPQREIELEDKAAFLKTLLHEIFHIYSRYHPEKRQKLYAIIGFERPKEAIQIPEILAKRLLQNPDGIDCNYTIKLSDENGRSFQAMPLIYAKKRENNSPHSFFSSLVFEVFEIIKNDNQASTLKTKTDENFRSTIKLATTNFHEKIGPNTDYIIHPDEILADNFALLALSKNDIRHIEDLEPSGKKLLEKIEICLGTLRK